MRSPEVANTHYTSTKGWMIQPYFQVLFCLRESAAGHSVLASLADSAWERGSSPNHSHSRHGCLREEPQPIAGARPVSITVYNLKVS